MSAGNGARPVILTLTRFYVPGYKAGGPIRSIANMVAGLSSEFDFRVLCTDRDQGDHEPYPGLLVDRWDDRSDHAVMRLSPSRQTLGSIAKAIRTTRPDVLYLNSFFDPLFSICPMLVKAVSSPGAPAIVLAPRGEFSQGALSIKPMKKQAFLTASRFSALHRNVNWHASTTHEAEDIKRVFGPDVRLSIAIDPPHMAPAPIHKARPLGDPLRLIFLSRLAPMKNLEFALAVLRDVRVRVDFDIYGQPGDAVYMKACQALAAVLPSNVQVRFLGPVPHEQVADVLASYDLMFVPTKGENFGHVFLEALAAGTPVLTSDQTPWRNLEQKGVGWALPLSQPQNFVRAVEAAAGWSVETQDDYRRRAIDFARSHAVDTDAVEATCELFRSAATSRYRAA